MTPAACLTVGTALPTVTITSTFWCANSAAISVYRSVRPSDHRYSIATVYDHRPSRARAGAPQKPPSIERSQQDSPRETLLSAAFRLAGHLSLPAKQSRRLMPAPFGRESTLCYNRFVGRRRRERLLTMRVASKPGGAVLICPTGKSVNCLSSPICKNILVFARPKSNLYPSTSRPTEGRWPSSRTRGGMRWTRQRFARHVMAGWASACERSTAR